MTTSVNQVRLCKELNQNNWITGCEKIQYFLKFPEVMATVFLNETWALIGFDDLPPVYQQWIVLLEKNTVTVNQVDLSCANAEVHQLSFKTEEEEFIAAARWAKNLVEKGINNIGIVHPELAMNRNKVEEVFLAIFHPDQIYCAQKIVSHEFSLSAGTPLGTQWMVKVALNLLSLVKASYRLSDIDFMLRQGYIGSNISHSTENLRVVNLIKQTGCTIWPIQLLLNWLAMHTESQYILAFFQKFKLAKFELNSPINIASFVQFVKKILAIFDFPGERKLSSLEYQTLDCFYRAMESFVQLALISPAKKYHEWVIEFETYLTFIPFQPESGEVPVNITGVLEASGQIFSHLWIMGMNNQNWPASADPNPFIPYFLQREKKMPHASSEREYELSTKITERLKKSAGRVIFSYGQYDQDKAYLPSDCIKSIATIPFGLIEQSRVILENQEYQTELFEDTQAPKVQPAEKISGGSSILKAQAACPFKAFAEVRLNLKKIDLLEPVLGISAMERGIIVHDILDKLWAELNSHQRLCDYVEQDLELLIEAKINNSIDLFRKKDPSRLGDVFWKNEKINLHQVLLNWLKLEKKREPFEVVLRESWQKIQLEGLTLNLRIDRMDLTLSKEAILIDYKTGEMSFSTCFGERLSEPQLPIYCLLAQETKPLGVAFGVVKPTGECDFIGITYSEGVLPSVKALEDQKNYLAKLGVDCKNKLASDEIWQALITYWQVNLGHIAKQFMSGIAAVSPKDHTQTCRYCHLTTLCRIHEKIMT